MASGENEEKLEALWITAKAKAKLDTFKIHPREPYYSVMDRILFNDTTVNNKPLK